MTKNCIDISFWNDAIDWKQTAPICDVVIAKSLEYVADSRFAEYWAALKTHPEIVRGSYYFFRAAHDPVQKAQQFVNIVNPKSGDVLALDMEEQDTPGIIAMRGTVELWARAKAWLDEVERLTGRRAMIYTSRGWWNGWMCTRNWLGQITAPAWTDKYPLWHAQYTTATTPVLPQGWTSWMMWQYSSTGTVAGCNGSVDMNRLNVTLDQLRAKFGGAPGPVVVPPPVLTDAQVIAQLVSDWRKAHPGQ